MVDVSSDLSKRFRAAVDDHLAGDLDAAASAYGDILAVAPNHAGALHLLGVVSGQRGDHWRALDLIGQSLRSDPDSPEAHYNLGFNLQQLGDFVQAGERYRRALALRPDYHEARNNLGNVLGELGCWSEATEHFQHLLTIPLDHAPTYNNLGRALLNRRRIGEAVHAYRRALELNPAHAAAHSNLLFALNHDPDLGPEELFAEHQRWAATHALPADISGGEEQFAGAPGRRLRVGYVSGDFWDHAVCASFELLLENHDRGHFEVYCYANHQRSDAVTGRLKAKSEHWVTIAGQTDGAAAERIRRDRIDVLVDLSGHTARNRLTMFARKPAPVQVTWLGYPNTTGMTAIDYRVTDHVADPAGRADRLHTERLVRLNRCFLCFRPPEDAPPIAPLPARDNGHVTFGSFNNLTKLTAGAIRVWSAILRAIPGSRLFLKAPQLADEPIRQELSSLFACEGIVHDRLRFASRTITKTEHLRAYGGMDIALDTFPYNGTTTTNEALWMGVPVVTLRGTRHMDRVGASLLTAVGLSDLIAAAESDYVARAVAVANDLDGLERLRAGLRDRLMHSELCDGAAFATAMEDAYRRMWLTRRDG